MLINDITLARKDKYLRRLLTVMENASLLAYFMYTIFVRDSMIKRLGSNFCNIFFFFLCVSIKLGSLTGRDTLYV